MNQHELHNYLPFNTQYRNKYEDSCPLFYGELAVADSDFRILTARGPSLCEGSRFALTDANKRFLFKTLTESRRVVLRRRSQIVLVSGELLPAGFYLLLLPEGERNAVAGAMSYLAGMRDMILSAAARKAAEKSVGDEGFSAAEDEMALLDGILRPESGLSLAELCERIAFYAGCHIRFDDSPRGEAFLTLCEQGKYHFMLWFAFAIRPHLSPAAANCSQFSSPLQRGRLWCATLSSGLAF